MPKEDDPEVKPLSQSEREELEELRALKAQREAEKKARLERERLEEKARLERAELEKLREEQMTDEERYSVDDPAPMPLMQKVFIIVFGIFAIIGFVYIFMNQG